MASDKLCRRLARLLLISTTLVAAAASAVAEPRCLCRYDGKLFEQGQCTCIVISGNARYACCERVLNNSSWSFVSDGCDIETSMHNDVDSDTATVTANRSATESEALLSNLFVPVDR